MTYRTDLITGLIRDVPDFPEPGVTFKDITPLLANANGYAAAISELVDTAPRGVDVVLGMEARGFMFAGPVALSLGAGFVPVRKPGKLPGDVYSQSFVLEYGSATLTVHQDAVQPGSTTSSRRQERSVPRHPWWRSSVASSSVCRCSWSCPPWGAVRSSTGPVLVRSMP